MHIFFSPGFSVANPFLSVDESWHCCKVLRLKKEDEIWVTDGNGTMAKSKIKNADPKRTEVRIQELLENFGKRNYYIHLAIAPTKNIDRIEWLVEKCVEVGIDEISFLQCERSERKIIKPERLIKIASEAMKQSMKAFFPKINDLQPFNEFIKKENQAHKMIAYLDEGNKMLLSHVIKAKGEYCIMIGPEGDFSNNEIMAALNNNYKAVSLGESRLRTETAGLMACHTIHIMNEL